MDEHGLLNTDTSCTPCKENKVDAMIAIKRGLNYLAVPIRWSGWLMKVSRWMCSKTAAYLKKTRLQLHSNNFGLKQLSTTVKEFH